MPYNWADEGWNAFADEFLAAEPRTKSLLLLKQAWLHGARTAIDQASSIVGSSAPSDITEEADPTPWCVPCGALRKADCNCGPVVEND